MPPSKSPAPEKKQQQQSKLNFAAKRDHSSASAAGTKGKGKASTKAKPTTPVNANQSPIVIESESEDVVELEVKKEAGPPAKKRKIEEESSVKKEKAKGKGVFKPRHSIENAEGGITPVVEESAPEQEQEQEQADPPNLKVNDRKCNKLYGESRAKMGNIPPIHTEKQNKIHHILRVFDLSYEYGPCIGVSRLQRWERAEALGLTPPPEVRDILVTKEGREKPEYSQCVFYAGEV
ncbi:hypothetical protein K474DRAFT_1667052 [Panus rudis PR-1116 ss-1]|nr:hypothetical protein K474DRAFT_1667052 [Panus rudis PR-1116 ss-1]